MNSNIPAKLITALTRCYPYRSTGMLCTDALLCPFCSNALLRWWIPHNRLSHFHQHQPVLRTGKCIRGGKKRFGSLNLKLHSLSMKLTASISCLTSSSVSFVPCLARPPFNSSRVMVPLLSVSMLLNISFRPRISSSDKHPAITWRVKKNMNSSVFRVFRHHTLPIFCSHVGEKTSIMSWLDDNRAKQIGLPSMQLS